MHQTQSTNFVVCFFSSPSHVSKNAAFQSAQDHNGPSNELGYRFLYPDPESLQRCLHVIPILRSTTQNIHQVE
jgi:hypothetical protein